MHDERLSFLYVMNVKNKSDDDKQWIFGAGISTETKSIRNQAEFFFLVLFRENKNDLRRTMSYTKQEYDIEDE